MSKLMPVAWIIPAGFFLIYLFAADLPNASGRADCIANLRGTASPSLCVGHSQYEGRRSVRETAVR